MESSYQEVDIRLDIIFHALSNRTRRALLLQLREGPQLVTKLAQSYAMSLNAISKHLLVLERSGLIGRKVSGREHSCFLKQEASKDADQWLNEHLQFWDNNLDNFAAYVEAQHDGGVKK